LIDRIGSPVSFIDRDFVLKSRNQVEGEETFAETLRGILGQVNRDQLEADEAVNQMLAGDLQNIHHVMIRAEEAQLSLQLTVQVVNKVLQAYQEISRMQI
jgi:flagellar hook-basal body complex protein FliE